MGSLRPTTTSQYHHNIGTFFIISIWSYILYPYL
jgi:hypothetical protein